jgi:carbonic anhydrase/acetyltransferase-like protein (isoleucine patch superfamily)
MVIIEYNGKKPTISDKAYVSPMATLIGDVKVNDNAIIWPGSILRGENAEINIGEYSTIFDGVILFSHLKKSPINIGRY